MLNALENYDIDIYYQATMADYTTFRLGGPCSALINCQTPNQLEKCVDSCIEKNLPFILIGGGSNLVVSDAGVECHVIRYVSDTPLIERQGHDLLVSGSTGLDQLAQFAVEHSLEGLNCATGIPGSVGGAIVGNAGAFGKQIGDAVNTIDVIQRDGSKKELKQNELGFTYRNSHLRKSGDIVVSAKLSLKPGDHTALLKERNEILSVRHAKHPDLSVDPCAGSFFRNIEPTSAAGKRQAAGWFLDQAGGKELSSGGAKIFDKHANIIIKSEYCKAQDVFELSRKMAQLAKEKFDLDLVREVRFVGKFDGMPEHVRDVIW